MNKYLVLGVLVLFGQSAMATEDTSEKLEQRKQQFLESQVVAQFMNGQENGVTDWGTNEIGNRQVPVPGQFRNKWRTDQLKYDQTQGFIL